MMVYGSRRATLRREASRPARTAGFTMIEVLFAIGVLTVAFLGMITVLLTSHSDISQSGRDTTASVAAQSLGENMRNQPAVDWAQLDGISTDNPGACPGAPGTRLNNLCLNWVAAVSGLPQGLGTIAVTRTPNPVTGITFNQATITVGWAEAGRGSRQLTLIVGRSN